MTAPTLVVELRAPRWMFTVTLSMLCFSLGMTAKSCSDVTADESEPEGCDESIVTVSREHTR
jgi:hypothetical protein